MIVVGQDGTLKLGTADYNFNALTPSVHSMFYLLHVLSIQSILPLFY